MWLEDPVTLRLLNRLTEAKVNSLDGLHNIVLGTSDESMFKQETLGKLLGYKAQIQVVDLLLDLKDFLELDEVVLDEISGNSEPFNS